MLLPSPLNEDEVLGEFVTLLTVHDHLVIEIQKGAEEIPSITADANAMSGHTR